MAEIKKKKGRVKKIPPPPRNPHGTWSDPQWSDEMRSKCYDYLENYNELQGDVIPSMEGLSEHLNARIRYLTNWVSEDKHPELTEVVKKIKAKQKKIICNKALDGTFNSGFSKFLLIAAHGMSEARSDAPAEQEPVKEVKITVITGKDAVVNDDD